MKITKAVKEHIKRQPKKVKELPNEFVNEMGAYCIDAELHMKTIYQLCKVAHIDQMLNTMYDTVVKEYNLHEPTLEKLRDKSINEVVQKKLKEVRLKLPKLL